MERIREGLYSLVLYSHTDRSIRTPAEPPIGSPFPATRMPGPLVRALGGRAALLPHSGALGGCVIIISRLFPRRGLDNRSITEQQELWEPGQPLLCRISGYFSGDNRGVVQGLQKQDLRQQVSATGLFPLPEPIPLPTHLLSDTVLGSGL